MCSRACGCDSWRDVLFLDHRGKLLASALREEVGSPHPSPPFVSVLERRWAFPPSSQDTKLPAFCRAGRAGRKSWSSQHVPPSRPEPKATVHKCSMLSNTAHSCTMRARCTKPRILWIQGACARALVAVTHGVTCFFLIIGENSSPQHLGKRWAPRTPPPSLSESASSPPRVKARLRNGYSFHFPEALALQPPPVRPWLRKHLLLVYFRQLPTLFASASCCHFVPALKRIEEVHPSSCNNLFALLRFTFLGRTCIGNRR